MKYLISIFLIVFFSLTAFAAQEYKVLWDKPLNADEAELIGYRLWVGSTKPEDLVDGNIIYQEAKNIPVAEYTEFDPGDFGTTYTFSTGTWSVYVTAYNITGESAPSNIVPLVVEPPLPDPPRNNRTKTIDLSFNFDQEGKLESIKVKDVAFYESEGFHP